MTGPVTTEALVEKLARDLAREGGWNDPDAPWTENQVIIARGGAGEPVWRDFVDNARSLLGRETFTTLLAALQQVTAERDARGEVIASLVDELARLRAEVEAVLDEMEPQVPGGDRFLPPKSLAERVRNMAHEAVDGRRGEAGLLRAVNALWAERETKDRALQDALKAAIRAWSAKLHIPVTRMMSRELRAEFSTALARAATAREGQADG